MVQRWNNSNSELENRGQTVETGIQIVIEPMRVKQVLFSMNQIVLCTENRDRSGTERLREGRKSPCSIQIH